MNPHRLFFLGVILVVNQTRAATLSVTTTNHSGPGSLRQAILDANASPGADTVTFAIPGGSGLAIIPTNALPTVTDAVTIDGTTQPGYVNAPIIELNGQSAGAGTDGLRIVASNCVVRGLVINRFSGDGIEIATNGFCRVEGNIIGLGPLGTNDLGNSANGVFINNCRGNVIGGASASQRNIISGNNGHGISISGASASNNVVLGNWIGGGSAGTNRLANSGDGINLFASSFNRVGGSNVGEGNVISGNSSDGVEINGNNLTATRNVVQGNVIGADPSGTVAAANGIHGVFFTGFSRGNLVGGTAPGEGNVIAFNAQDGINVNQGTSNAFRANLIFNNGDLGIDLTPAGVTTNDAGDTDTGTANDLQNFPVITAATIHASSTEVQGTLNSLPNRTYAIDLFANVAPDNSGNGQGQEYLGSTTVTTDASGNGIFSATVGRAHGRYIAATATDPSGNSSEFSVCFRAGSTVPPQTFTVINTNNSGAGSLRQALLDADQVIAGGPHLIAFNIPGAGPHTITPPTTLQWPFEESLRIDGYTQPGAQTNSLANGNNAVLKIRLDGATGSGTGLRVSTTGNVVRGLAVLRFAAGIQVTNANNTIEGNFIGIDLDGTAKANGIGVLIGGAGAMAFGNLIGGASPGARNVISGNSQFGIQISTVSGSSTRVMGNFIGTDATGTSAIPNAQVGIQISASTNNVIGGATAAERNVISGNGASGGINISGPPGNDFNNRVLGNFIGVDVTGANALPNAGWGVTISNSRQNRIGGAATGEGNVIANNAGGVQILSNTNNAIRGNSIFNNGNLGIDLIGNGVTTNDLNDADTGANFLQNYPVITAGFVDVATTTLSGTLSSAANAAYVLDFFASPTCDTAGFGEGRQYLGSTNVTTDASGNASFNMSFALSSVGRFLTATATDTNGNSSEFSPCFAAPTTLPPLTLTVVNTNDSGPGSLRQALIDSGTFVGNGPNRIHFNIPAPGPHTIAPVTQLPTNAQPVVIDGYTQPGATANTSEQAFNGALRIRLDGSAATGFGIVALRLQGGGSTVRGIAFTGWGNRNAIEISGKGSNVIAGCLIGIDVDGSDKHAGNGVTITDSPGNAIGGLAVADRNVISYNFGHAIFIVGSAASNNVVQGNLIGTDFSGTARRGNSINGVEITDSSFNVVGGSVPGARNVISANSRGVRINSSTPGLARGNVIQGNLIGTDVSGALALGNQFDGIVVQGAETIIGGSTAGARNQISGNGQFGIDLAPGSFGNVVLGNRIGVGVTGGAMGNTNSGIAISGSSNRIGGVLTGEGNVIAFNRAAGIYAVGGTANQVRGNSIFDNNSPFLPALGIDLGGDGVTANDVNDADTGPNNRQNFPLITSASGNASGITIGGTLNSIANQSYQLDFFANVTCDLTGNGEGQFHLGSGSVATDSSGNGAFNVSLSSAVGGRFITATATDPFGNTSEFSPCFEASVGNLPATFTVINTNDSGPGSLRQAILDSNGHVSSANNTIAFNIPGAGVRAIKLLSPLPLFTQPVTIDGFTQPDASANASASGNNANWQIELRGVGAAFTEEVLRLNIPNLVVRGLRITGSAGLGIEMVSSNCVVAGCFIHANAAGGIALNAAHANRIGGMVPAERNVISGHTGSRGIEISGGNGNQVLGNFIGPAPDGTSFSGVGQFDGVNIFNGSRNVIGDGTTAGANVIAFHQSDAVAIQSGTNNAVRANRIFSNSFAIDLSPDGVTANDPGDADSGANHLQNFPVLTNVIANAGSTVVQGTLNSRPNTTYTLEVFANTVCHFSGNGEGEFFLGSATVTTDGSGNAAFNVTIPATAQGNLITATATDPFGNTSEFSACKSTTVNLPPQTYLVTSTNDSGLGSLRQAILDSALVPNLGRDMIHFNIPGAGPHRINLLSALPSPRESLIIDGYSQPGASPNSSSNADNAVLKIQLDGSLAPDGSALDITNSGNTIRGLSLTRFGRDALFISAPSNVVEGNWIGVDPSGVAASNRSAGITIVSSFNLIGGTNLAARNIISANEDGILIAGAGASNNLVAGNFIGVGPSGTNAMGNIREGVLISGARANLIGGTNAGAENLIGGNARYGVRIDMATLNRVEGNFIGASFDFEVELANRTGGVVIAANASTNTIGGRVDEAGNHIAYNNGPGVWVQSGTQNAVLRNEIVDNAGKDIQITAGANDNVQPPILISAAEGSTIVNGRIVGARPNTTYELTAVAKYRKISGKRRSITLGSVQVTTDASGNASFNQTFHRNVPRRRGAGVVANLTCLNSSSENSNEAAIIGADEVDLQTYVDVTDPIARGANAVVTITVTNTGPTNATAVEVVSTQPPATTLVSAINPNGTTTTDGPDTTMQFGALAPGQGKSATITLRGDQSGLRHVSVNARSLTLIDGHPADNVATGTFFVLPDPNTIDLTIANFRASTRTPTAGVPFTYNAVIQNFGTSPVPNVYFEADALTPAVIFTGATSPAGPLTVTGSTVRGSLGPIGPLQTVPVTLNAAGKFPAPNAKIAARVVAPAPDWFLDNNLVYEKVDVWPWRLNVERDNGKVQLSWQTAMDNHLALEENRMLGDPSSGWTPSTGGSISNNGGLVTYTVSPTNPATFYRLSFVTPSPTQSVTIHQLDMTLDNVRHPFSEWGKVDLVYRGTNAPIYFNLSVSNDWVIRNVPLINTDQWGSNSIYFPLTTYGVMSTSAPIAFSFSNGPSFTLPINITNVDVFPNPVNLNHGIDGFPIVYRPPQLMPSGEVVTSATVRATFPNLEQGWKECAPAAVLDSLLFLNTNFNLNISSNHLTMEAMKEATLWDPNGASPDWAVSKDWYMQSNNIPIETIETTDLTNVIVALQQKHAVEIHMWGHVAVVVGITLFEDGNCTLELQDDSFQGEEGRGVGSYIVVWNRQTDQLIGTMWTRRFFGFVIQRPKS